MSKSINQAAWAAAQDNNQITFQMDGITYETPEALQQAINAQQKAEIDEVLGRIETTTPRQKKTGNKTNAKRTQADGHWFDSGLEARRYSYLKHLNEIGVITDLIFEKKKLTTLYPIQPYIDHFGSKHKGRKWTPDFQYRFEGLEIIEDVKGFKPRDFKLIEMLLFRDFPDLNIWINHNATAMPTFAQFRRVK